MVTAMDTATDIIHPTATDPFGPTTATDTIAGRTMATVATATAPIGPITATIAPIDTATATGMAITGPGDMATATIVRAITTDIDCRHEGVLAGEFLPAPVTCAGALHPSRQEGAARV